MVRLSGYVRLQGTVPRCPLFCSASLAAAAAQSPKGLAGPAGLAGNYQAFFPDKAGGLQQVLITAGAHKSV